MVVASARGLDEDGFCGEREGAISLYHHPQMRCYVLVHMDDLHGCGPEENIVSLFESLAKEVNLKFEGPFSEGMSYSYLKMTRKVTTDGIYVTPDVAHIKSTAEQLGLEVQACWDTDGQVLRPRR
jgi:hypothetical protein